MSWFGPIEDLALALPREGAEIEPGVRLERRALLLGGCALGTLGLSGAARAAAGSTLLGQGGAAQDAADDVGRAAAGDVETFLQRAASLGREFFAAADGNEEAYLLRLAALLAEVQGTPADLFADEQPRRGWSMKRFGGESFAVEGDEARGDGGGEKGTRRRRRSPGLGAFQMKFRPDAFIGCHDHLRYAGVILLLEGEVRCRSFDLVSGSRAQESVRVQETADVLLLPGRFSTLATGRQNLHELRAGPQGARAIDVFTFFEGAGGSRYLELEQESPVDAERRVFDARWRGGGR